MGLKRILTKTDAENVGTYLNHDRSWLDFLNAGSDSAATVTVLELLECKRYLFPRWNHAKNINIFGLEANATKNYSDNHIVTERSDKRKELFCKI